MLMHSRLLWNVLVSLSPFVSAELGLGPLRPAARRQSVNSRGLIDASSSSTSSSSSSLFLFLVPFFALLCCALYVRDLTSCSLVVVYYKTHLPPLNNSYLCASLMINPDVSARIDGAHAFIRHFDSLTAPASLLKSRYLYSIAPPGVLLLLLLLLHLSDGKLGISLHGFSILSSGLSERTCLLADLSRASKLFS